MFLICGWSSGWSFVLLNFKKVCRIMWISLCKYKFRYYESWNRLFRDKAVNSQVRLRFGKCWAVNLNSPRFQDSTIKIQIFEFLKVSREAQENKKSFVQWKSFIDLSSSILIVTNKDVLNRKIKNLNISHKFYSLIPYKEYIHTYIPYRNWIKKFHQYLSQPSSLIIVEFCKISMWKGLHKSRENELSGKNSIIVKWSQNWKNCEKNEILI